jgi:hypothetical protein
VCLKGKKTAPHEPGNYVCGKCGATATKADKDKICEPEKIKADKGAGKPAKLAKSKKGKSRKGK